MRNLGSLQQTASIPEECDISKYLSESWREKTKVLPSENRNREPGSEETVKNTQDFALRFRTFCLYQEPENLMPKNLWPRKKMSNKIRGQDNFWFPPSLFKTEFLTRNKSFKLWVGVFLPWWFLFGEQFGNILQNSNLTNIWLSNSTSKNLLYR